MSERKKIDRSNQWSQPVGITPNIMINAINEAKLQIYNMGPSPSRIAYAHASTESYNKFPYDYVPPFVYYPNVSETDTEVDTETDAESS